MLEEIDYPESSSRSTSKYGGVLPIAGDFEAPAALPVDRNGKNVMPWTYRVPTRLSRPESADLPIVDEDLVATEPVTPDGPNTTDDDESHVRIIGRSASGIRRHISRQQRAAPHCQRFRRVVRGSRGCGTVAYDEDCANGRLPTLSPRRTLELFDSPVTEQRAVKRSRRTRHTPCGKAQRREDQIRHRQYHRF